MSKTREKSARGYMKVGEWRTIKPRPDVYIHVQKVASVGPRGGRTIARHIRYVGSKKVKTIPQKRRKK